MSLSRFLPLTLRRLLSEGRDLKEPLYLHGATVFADISGFTPLSEALARMGREGAEFLTRTLNGYFSAVITSIHGNGGDVMRFAGDAVTAFFPDPDGEARALAAAWAIQTFMREHPETTSPVGTFPIRIKVGIAAGEHVLLIVGEGDARDYVFAGRPVDGSAEAEHHADPGDVVLHPSCRLSQGRFLKARPEDSAPVLFLGSAPPPLTEDACSPFLHPILVDRLGQGSERLLNEHRKATVLFVSFPGVSDYHDKAAVDRLRAFYIKTHYFVDCYEGNLNKVDMGDKGSKFLITFGAPLSHEDDADRAVRFALDLKDMAGTHGLALAVGLNRGTIFAGLIGDDQRCEYTVMGDEVNLAARLMQAAGQGRILAGPAVKEESRAFEFTALPPVALKGKSQPVHVFEPLQKEVEQQAGVGIFAGRAAEFREATAFVRQSGEDVRLLMVRGEAGIGKTAFLNFLFQQYPSPLRLVSGWCREFTSQFPYHPWKFILRRLLEVTAPEGVDPAEAWQALLKETVPELLPFAPILLDHLQLKHSLQPVAIDEQTRKSILHRQAGLLVQAAAQRSPLALSLTDVQWMDPESLSLLEDLLRTLGRPAPLVVLSGRALPAGMEGMAKAYRLELGPLPITDLKKIVLAFLKVQRAPDKLLDDAVQAAHGNPLLLQETLRAYMASGYMTRDAQNPELLFVDETHKPTLPATLEGVVMARFDRLPAGWQALLKTLSVFGEMIPAAVARRAAESSGNDVALLDTLAGQGEFIARQGAGDLYAFPQSHIRSTIYDSLDFTSRRDLHLLAARVYRDALPPDLPESIQTVAFHYIESDTAVEGKEFLLKAGHLAYNAYAFPTALTYFRALFANRETLAADSVNEAAYLTGDILLKLGRFPEVQALLSESILGCSPAGDQRSRLLLLVAESHRMTGNFNVAQTYLQAAEQEAVSDLQHFKIAMAQGIMKAQMSKFGEALADFASIESKFRHAIPLVLLNQVALVKGPLLFMCGNPEKAQKTLIQALHNAQRNGDVQARLKILHNMGTFYLQASQHKKAYATFAKSLQVQETFGILQHHLITISQVGYEAMLAGDWREAHYQLNYGHALAKRFDDPVDVILLCNLAELKQCIGQYDSARRLLGQASTIARNKNTEYLRVLYYWIEFLSLLRYSKTLIRFLRKFKAQIEHDKADYWAYAHDAYLACALQMNGDREGASRLAEITLANLVTTSRPKEEYLCLRTLAALIDSTSKKKKILEQLISVAEKTNEKRLMIEARLLMYEAFPEPLILVQVQRLLRQMPYADLSWKLYSLKFHELSDMGKKQAARKAKTYANAYRRQLQSHWPRGVTECSENGLIAKSFSIDPNSCDSNVGELPAIYQVLQD